MKVVLLLLIFGFVGFAVYWFGFRSKVVGGQNANAPVPQKVVPPTTAGGLIDQTLGFVNQGVSIYQGASDLYNKWAN